MRGVQCGVSDDESGRQAARKAVLGGATWQRCQFHLAQNAIHHAPNLAIRKRIGAELRHVWNALDLATATENLRLLVESLGGEKTMWSTEKHTAAGHANPAWWSKAWGGTTR